MALFALGLWSAVGFFAVWRRYASHAAQLLPYLGRAIAEAIGLGVSLIGLWRSKRWGWALALLADSVMCAFDLSVLLSSPILLERFPRVIVFQFLDYAALALLLHQPVRRFFAASKIAANAPGVQIRKPVRQIGGPERSLRIIAFFAVAIVITCAATAFALALLYSKKEAIGVRGLLFFFLLAFPIGGLAALLFSVLMTLTARLSPARLWVWILTGALLAPGMIFALAIAANGLSAATGRSLSVAHILLSYLCAGPYYLVGVWWLGIPIGIITAFVCCQLYPWAFGQAGTSISSGGAVLANSKSPGRY